MAKIVETASGDIKAEFRGHDNVVEAAQFCPPHAVAAIRELISLKVSSLYNSRKRKSSQLSLQAPDLLPAPVPANTLAFAVTASRDKTVKIWDAIRGQCLYTLVSIWFCGNIGTSS